MVPHTAAVINPPLVDFDVYDLRAQQKQLSQYHVSRQQDGSQRTTGSLGRRRTSEEGRPRRAGRARTSRRLLRPRTGCRTCLRLTA